MKIFRNNVGVEITLDEFADLLDIEESIDELSDILFALEEDDQFRKAAEEDELFEGEEVFGPFDAGGNVGVLEPPTPSINQYFFLGNPSEGLDTSYIEELSELANDQLKQVRRILDGFGSFLK